MFPSRPRAAVLPAEAAAGLVGGLAGLFLICTCASDRRAGCASRCPALFPRWEQPPLPGEGDRSSLSTGEAALQQQVKLWPA